jgi:hypothetical protein
MSPSKYERSRLTEIRTVAFSDIERKVSLDDVVEIGNRVDTLQDVLDIIPDVGAGKDFKKLAKALAFASREDAPSILMIGAHVIKCGLARLIIRLVERNVFSSISMTGAGAIHDLELALWGKTSESVEETLPDGIFGMSRETAEVFAKCLDFADKHELGLGESIGEFLAGESAPNSEISVLARCYELSVPVTVHLAIGADIINVHPVFEPAKAAEASYRDLQVLIQRTCELTERSVVLNVGSAVMLPEVFLKCLSAARNLGNEASGFLAANMDMIQHYRAVQNVVMRPTDSSSRQVLITGRHELMVPLLTAAVLYELEKWENEAL